MERMDNYGNDDDRMEEVNKVKSRVKYLKLKPKAKS